MLYEFQVFYTSSSSPGRLFDTAVRAETPAQARSLIEVSGIAVTSVGPGRPLLPSKPTLNREEAAVYLDVSESKISELQGRGALPRPQRNGHTVFRIEELEQYRSRAMQIEEWKAKL